MNWFKMHLTLAKVIDDQRSFDGYVDDFSVNAVAVVVGHSQNPSLKPLLTLCKKSILLKFCVHAYMKIGNSFGSLKFAAYFIYTSHFVESSSGFCRHLESIFVYVYGFLATCSCLKDF